MLAARLDAPLNGATSVPSVGDHVCAKIGQRFVDLQQRRLEVLPDHTPNTRAGPTSQRSGRR